jgi:hypothetical protein
VSFSEGGFVVFSATEPDLSPEIVTVTSAASSLEQDAKKAAEAMLSTTSDLNSFFIFSCLKVVQICVKKSKKRELICLRL